LKRRESALVIFGLLYPAWPDKKKKVKKGKKKTNKSLDSNRQRVKRNLVIKSPKKVKSGELSSKEFLEEKHELSLRRFLEKKIARN
jgi:hypothetical protein